MRRVSHVAKGILRWVLYAVVAVLVVAGAAVAALETAWGKNQLRELIVRQANQYLTATLQIGRLEGSLFRGIRLGDILLSQDGQKLISIDDVSLSYSIRELFEGGTVIREIRLARPHIVASRLPDGRWNLGALIKRDAQEKRQRGPGRPIHLQSIEVTDGSVALQSPLTFGIARLPTSYEDLDLRLSFDYEPVAWQLNFQHASWRGHSPDLTISKLTGRISQSSDGLTFEKLHVETPTSRLDVDGGLDRRVSPSVLAMQVNAERFLFEEWSGLVAAIRNMSIDARFEARLSGPVRKLSTDLNLRSDGGDVVGPFMIDTTSPGWRGVGTVDVRRLNLAKWLNRPADASDISGRTSFDISMPPGAHFPRGTYAFDGSHAAFMNYAADNLKARGHITPTDVHVAEATATAYGAAVRLDAGSIGVDSPFPFKFAGVVTKVDLRRVPAAVPVPHVESTLTFAYDVSGQFRSGFLTGGAVFDESEFLGIRIGAETTGRMDTAQRPFTYSGEGDLSEIDLNRVGAGLDVDWLQDARYSGMVAGHFQVEGAGADMATMTIAAGGHLSQADMFGGRLSDAEVDLRIRDGSLTGSYDGLIEGINPALALADRRYHASLTGSGKGRIEVTDLLLRSPALDDYAIDAQLTLNRSRVRGVDVDAADLSASLADRTLSIARFHGSGPAIELDLAGRVELDGERASQVDYNVVRADLAELEDILGRKAAGQIVTTGTLTGPTSGLRLVGKGTVAQLDVSGLKALTGELAYDAVFPSDEPARAAVRVDGHLSFIEALGQQLQAAVGVVTYDNGKASANLRLARADGITGTVDGAFLVHAAEKRVDVQTLAIAVDRSHWRLMPPGPARLSWSDQGFAVEALTLGDTDTGSQTVALDGTWFPAGGGTLNIRANHVSLDGLSLGGEEGPARYGGIVDADVVLRGTRQQPIVTGQFAIADGRVWRTPYEKLAGRVDYIDKALQIDLRLDQSPGVWLTVIGSIPAEVLSGKQSDLPMSLDVASSTVSLGLIEGVTNVVRNVTGEMQIGVKVIGTPRDPHFDGRVDLRNAGFLVTSSGARYQNGRVGLQLTTDRVTVETLHLEDADRNPLDVSGSLATHELRVSDLAIDVTAKAFRVLQNEFGRMDIDAQLALRGRFESPRLDGRVTVARSELAVDAILERTMLRPYSTEAAAAPSADAIVALNPWDRIGLGIELHVPGTLRMVGDNIQVTPGTPLGLGAINLRAVGDLFLYKDPAQPLYVTGSLDSVTGTYTFQGRRFDLDPSSSINFRADLNPELYVTVTREISGVETRVTIAGPLSQPELRLASTPPLDASDILSLIVFNASVNELSAAQQQQLAVRAGTIAAGFLADPVLTALQQSLGIDTLEIEPSADWSGGTRVTIGNEIAPGLVARFSRQFGPSEYDEATLEYYLSQILRIRATFSDATELTLRSPFRRVERAGVDLLLFFSF